MPTHTRSSRRIRELDGIRGLAILLVLIMHYFVEISQTRYAPYFRLAWSGVDLFFVLSGFLIAGILLDAKPSGSYFKTFYMRRFYRILPLYAVCLAIFLVGVYVFRGGHHFGPIWDMFNTNLPLWPFFLFLQNFAMAAKATFGSRWLGVTWSLAVEEQFYLLLPLTIRRLKLETLFWFTVTMVIFAPVLRFIFEVHTANGILIYTMLPCRADSLGCGVLLAIAYRNPKVWSWFCSHRRYLYVAFLLLGLGLVRWTFHETWLMTRILFTWLGVFYSVLMLLVLANPGRLERALFDNPVMVKLGTVAYAIYLFHSGLLAAFHYWFFHMPPYLVSRQTLFATVLALLATLGLAEISWRVLERPLIKMGHARFRYVAPVVPAVKVPA